MEQLSNYEKIGNSLYRYYRGINEKVIGGATAKRYLGEFIKRYELAPLFVVGWAAEDMAKAFDFDSDYWEMAVEDFRLPFPEMLLDFPKGLLKYPHQDEASTDAIVYIREVAPPRPAAADLTWYLVEIIRTKESYHRELATADDEERRWHDDPNRPTDVLNAEGGEHGSVAHFLMGLKGGAMTLITSKEYMYHCPSEILPLTALHCNSSFSLCKERYDEVCDNPMELCQDKRLFAMLAAKAIVHAVGYINRPDLYMVRETPEMSDREKRLRDKGKHPVFAKKVHHVILDHDQLKAIAKRAQERSGEHASPLPHERRGHWRHLRAEVYKEKRRLWIRKQDINKGAAWKVGKRVYEVVN